MRDWNSFDYAIIRVVPYVERQEFVNTGIILFSRTLGYLDSLIDFELKRLHLFSPQANLPMICKQLETLAAICAGEAKTDPFHQLSRSERFNWLVAPRSTIIQMSPVHTGITNNPSQTLKQLYALLVAYPPKQTE